MGHTCTGDHRDHGDPKRGNQNSREHPLVARIAVVAILLAILLITWARVEVHGTGDLEAALAAPSAEHAPVPPPEPARTQQERDVDEAVTSSRFATGFSP